MHLCYQVALVQELDMLLFLSSIGSRATANDGQTETKGVNEGPCARRGQEKEERRKE